jgi:hypothetical protein
VREQIKSGVQLTFSIIAAILLIALLAAGVRRVVYSSHGDSKVGAVMLSFAIVILYLTARTWAKWFFAFCCGNVLRGVIMLALGRTTSVPSVVAPRSYVLQIVMMLALMAYLTNRFWEDRPQQMDSVCLVGAVVAVVFSMFGVHARVALLVATGFLGISFLANKLSIRRLRG